MGGITGHIIGACVHGAGRRPRGAAALGGLALLLGACVADQTEATVRPAVVRVPAEAPRTTGRERAADADHLKLVASFGGEARAPNVMRLLTEVTDRLVRASDRPDQSYTVTLLDSPVVNAFALPNGRLYVTRGLVALASDTSEVAAVLAHEMAHVTLNHATARSELELRSALVSRVVADVLNDPDTGAQLQHQSRFALARFSREQELEADATGVRTLAKAGYDPFAAGRFLTALSRSTGLKAGSANAPDMLATHPGTAERITQVTRAARRIGAPGIGTDDRATYLAAVDGLAYGDNPRDGAVRGHRFIHPGLGIAFEVPEGFTLENTRSAVLGTTQDGSRRLLFDQIEAKEGQPLDAVLKASWNDAFDPAGFETREVGGHPAAFALSRGKEWTFRLAAIRIGDSTYRMIMAAKGTADPDPAFRRWTSTLVAVSPDEAVLRPLRLQVVQAMSANAEDLARRMAVPDRALDRFLVLNGLERGAALVPGRGYKIIVE
ncbi:MULTISPECIES: M48 family metalloprotease [Methylobacterium]|jgi:predicted Zn-dependent protease|uniref:Peptidase M48 Ste24p n=1 Tax=Methylobacterium oryzae CBMB20 TaxID=693986 RepID=A0A089QEB3_9HYPH|nr:MULTISPECIES: M48 family metalloprotease [Methylobacterium]AIQ92904.1 Peptidase M48 Ste24p [Methylobacterium oryzae CBMB20]AWV15632.1 peptidase M48 [Methylobacterium sp. XJLW]WFS06769.1 M48 family metalloprotease [Methylobacterium sp. 391_Methyba4]